jgi:hypothetical protein
MTSNNSPNNYDDDVILDITSNNEDDDDDKRPLLSDNPQETTPISTTPNVNIIRVPSISRYRLTNILRVLVFIEFLTMLSIWLAGKRISSHISFIKFSFNR